MPIIYDFKVTYQENHKFSFVMLSATDTGYGKINRFNSKSSNHKCSRRQILRHLFQFSKKIRYDISWESSAEADDSHEISFLICYFLKSGKI